MPRIPTITKSVVQMPTMNVSAASAPAQAKAQMGQAIAGIGNTALNIYDKVITKRLEAQRNNDLLKVENQMYEDSLAFSDELAQTTDYHNLIENFDERINSFKDKYSGLINENDPDASYALEKAYTDFSAKLKQKSHQRSTELTVEQGVAELSKNIDIASENYADAMFDKGARKNIKDSTFAKIDVKVSDATISATDAQKLKDSWIQNAEKLRAERLIDLNPEEAIKAISSGDFELPTDTRETLKAQAERQIEINKNKAEIIKNQIIQEEEKAKKEAKEAEKQVVYGEILKGNYAGAYEKAMSSQNLDNDEKVSLQTSIKTLSEKSKNGKDPTEESDPQTYAGLSKIVYTDPESITPNEIYSYVGKGEDGGISTKQAETLINELQTHKEKKEPDPWEAAAKAVNENFARDRKEGLFGEGSEGDLEYARQLQDFSTWRKMNPDKDPTAYYERIIESQTVGLRNRLFDNIPTPKEAREAIKSEQDKVVIRQKIEQPIEIEGISEADQNIIKKALEDAGQPVTEANILHVYKMNTK